MLHNKKRRRLPRDMPFHYLSCDTRCFCCMLISLQKCICLGHALLACLLPRDTPFCRFTPQGHTLLACFWSCSINLHSMFYQVILNPIRHCSWVFLHYLISQSVHVFTLYSSFQIRFDCPFVNNDSLASTLQQK